MAVNAYGQYTISIVDDGVGIKSKQDYYTLSNQKDSLDGAKSYFEKDASGAIASFDDGAEDAPMSVVVDIDPVQDLNGYDNPWPGGGGKNKFNVNAIANSDYITVNNGVITVIGQSRNTIKYLRELADLSVGESYILSATTTGTANYIYLSGSNESWYFGTQRTITQADLDSRVLFYSGGADVTANISNMMIRLASVSDATFAPYSNICPISGRTGAKVTRTGRNLLNDSVKTQNRTYIYFNSTGDSSEKTMTLPAGTYTISVSYTGTVKAHINVYRMNPYERIAVAHSATMLTFTLTKTEDILLWMQNSNFSIQDIGTIQLEPGSTAHAYEPYTAVTHEIPFSTEVYGGKLNVETGECVVDRAIVDLGSLNWEYLSSSSSIPYGAFYTNIWGKANKENDLVCSMYPLSRNYFRQNKRVLGNSGSTTVYVIDSAYTTATAFKTAVTGQQLVYQFATPITLTLDPVEMRSLLGDNNVFADTGDVSVTYINEQDLTWETEPLVPNEEGKYLWWKYKITKDDDSTWESDPAVIGMFSDSDRVLANIEKAQNTADFAQGAAQMAQSSANYAQDAADRAQQSANNAQSSADQANEGVATLRNDVASNYVTIADFSVSNESIQSSVTEVRTIAEAAQLSADTNYSDLSGNLEDLEGRVSTNETSISDIVTATSNLEQRSDSISATVEEHTQEIAQLQGYTDGLKATMNLTAAGLDISGGDTTSNTHVHINGDGVSITDGTDTPAYFHGQESKMINVEITEILRIGNHKLLARSGGTNTTVVYVGDE